MSCEVAIALTTATGLNVVHGFMFILQAYRIEIGHMLAVDVTIMNVHVFHFVVRMQHYKYLLRTLCNSRDGTTLSTPNTASVLLLKFPRYSGVS
jgi:hypothetical protein